MSDRNISPILTITKEKQVNNTAFYILVAIILIALAGIFLMYYFLYKIENDYINPKYCPPQVEGFAVRPATVGTLKYLCGSDGKQPCEFPIDNLFAAITKCNSLSTICNAFTYDGVAMNIVDENNLSASGTTNNLYLRLLTPSQ